MVIDLKDSILEEFCHNHCPQREMGVVYEKCGRMCPNCMVETYHFWLMKRLETDPEERGFKIGNGGRC